MLHNASVKQLAQADLLAFCGIPTVIQLGGNLRERLLAEH